MTTYAIIGGSNFRGSWKVYQSRQDAGKFLFLATTELSVKRENIVTLFDDQYTRSNILNAINQMATKLKSDDTLIMYFAGHGTQIPDLPVYDNENVKDETDGMDEALQTDDFQTVIDDELTTPFVKSASIRIVRFKLILIADTCHSPSFDMWQFVKFNANNTKNGQLSRIKAISIKSALDNQSALQSGDGSYMSSLLFPLLHANPYITLTELQKRLTKEMHEGYAGDMQSCVIEVSNVDMWDELVFH
jgi:hypothetical protein